MTLHLGWPLRRKKRDRARDWERQHDVNIAQRAMVMLARLAPYCPDEREQAIARQVATSLRLMVDRWERNDAEP